MPNQLSSGDIRRMSRRLMMARLAGFAGIFKMTEAGASAQGARGRE